MIPHVIPEILPMIPQHDTQKNSIMKYPSLRFVFDRKKVSSKTKKGLVQLEVLSEGKRKFIGTGIKLFSDQWNDRKKVLNSADMLELNQRLDEMMSIVQGWINELMKKKEPFDFGALESFLKCVNKTENYIEYVERRINERNDIKGSTKSKHRGLITSLKEFGKIVYISDLTKENILLYDNFLHSKGYSQPTIHGYHKNNKVYIHDAMNYGLLKDYPYAGIKIKRGKHKLRRYLYQEELDKIREAEIPLETINRVRDLFVFQCYTGLSYADFALFDFTHDIIEHEGKYIIRDVRIKTVEDYYIVLLSPALQLLKKYNYKMPVISNQQYNLRLKIVADYAGLDKKLTTHMARHTFATLAITNGVELKVVSKMLGHSSVRTTEIYATVINKAVDDGYELFEKKISG